MLATASKSLRRVCAGLLLSLVASAQKTEKPLAQVDPVEEHFRAAQTFQVTGEFDRSAVEYRQTIATALDRLGDIRVATGRYEGGIELLKIAREMLPAFNDAGIDLAGAYFHAGDFGRCQSTLKEILTQDPQDSRALNLLGKIYFMQGNFHDAEEQLQASMKIQPEFDSVYSLALVELKLKKTTAAVVLFDEMLASMKPSPELHDLIGVAYRQTGYVPEAAGQFRKAIALDPKHPGTHSGLGLTYLLQEPAQLSAASEEFRAELAIAPKDYAGHYFLGLIELEQRRPAQAALSLQEAVRLEPKRGDALLALSRAYLGSGRPELAISTLRKSLVLLSDPWSLSEQASAHKLLSQALDRLGKKEESAAHAAKAAEIIRSQGQTDKEVADTGQNGLRQDVIRFDEEAFRSSTTSSAPNTQSTAKLEAEYDKSIFPVLGDSYNNLGVIDARAGRYAQAASEFAQAARWNPKIESLDRNWGLAAFRADLNQQAIDPLSRQLKHSPDDLTVREMLAMSYFVTNKFNKSAELFAPIVDRLPNDAGLLYAAGMSLVRSGDPAAGAKLFSRMLEQDANVPEVHLMLGEAHAQQAEPEEAQTEFARALQLNPKLHEAHYFSGMVYFQQGKMDEAAQEFQAELGLNPQYVPAEYQLAYVRLTQHQVEDAVRLLNDVVGRSPSYSDAYYQRGRAMLEKGDTKAAIQDLETAVRLQPSAAYSYYQLSLAYRRDGRVEEAQQTLKKYQALHGNIPRPEAKN